MQRFVEAVRHRRFVRPVPADAQPPVDAVKPRASPRGPAADARHNRDSQSSYGNNFLMRSTPVSRPPGMHDLGLIPNQVWGLTKTDHDWSEKLEAALTAARRDDLKHGTNAAYVRGCVCRECREYLSLIHI